MYRQQKGAKNEDTIADWSADFCSWLKSFGKIRDEDITDNIELILSSWFENLQRDALRLARNKKVTIPSQDYVNLLLSEISKLTNRLSERPDALTDTEQKAAVEEFGETITKTVSDIFQVYESEDVLKYARELGLLLLFKNIYSDHSSGIVIAGFGEKEIFPFLVHFDSDGYVGRTIKISKIGDTEITRDMSAAIVPFAQKEMVQTFMNGIDPSFSSNMYRSFYNTLVQGCLEVLEKHGSADQKTDEIKAKIREAASEGITKLVDDINKFSNRKFARPIVEMVSMLPKDELPALAEALVSLTSIKRHFTNEVETVGGPIDVALITKGDGFIWIKRKHYFKPELNLQFQLNYMRGLDAGGSNERIHKSASSAGRRTRGVKAKQQTEGGPTPAG